MQFSEHYINQRMETRGITLEQAEAVVNNPIRTLAQDDGRTRYWGYVAALGHYIRVVVESDGETILTTFIDSRFQPLEEGNSNGSGQLRR